MEPPSEPPKELGDLDSIQNLETARLALRWALERLHKLDTEKEALAQSSSTSERAVAKLREEYASLQKTLAMRSAESDQRELYYAKLEEFLTLKLEGKLDPSALAKRELASRELQEMLERKQAHLEKDFAARKEAVERDYQRLRAEVEQEARARQERAERALDSRKSALEQEALAKLAEAHEREALVRLDEQRLAERRKQFEEYYAAQRAQLHSETRNFKEEIQDQVDFRSGVAERLFEERRKALEEGWNQERALLAAEVASWRRKAQEAQPRLIELENALALAEESAETARALSQRQLLSLEQWKRAWQSERETLAAEAEKWRARAAAQQDAEKAELTRALGDFKQKNLELSARLSNLEKRLAVSEESLEQARVEAESSAAAFGEDGKAWEKEREALKAALAEARHKAQEALPRLLEFEKGLLTSEENQKVLERHLARLAEQNEAAEREREALLAEIRDWRARHQQAGARALEVEKRLALAEESASLAVASAERRSALLEERLAALGRERDALVAELRRGLQKSAVPPPAATSD